MEAATLGKGLATSVLLAITPISKTYSLPEKNFQQETLLWVIQLLPCVKYLEIVTSFLKPMLNS